MPPYELVGPWQTAKVVVNGLAVRSGPSTSAPLVAAYRWDDARGTEVPATDEVRLDNGHYDDFRFDRGWVAGGDATSPWIVADDLPPLEPGQTVHGDAPDPYALAHDIGSERTTPFVLEGPVGIRWAAAAPDGGTCRIAMTLEPLGLEWLATDITGWSIGDDVWPRDNVVQESLPSGEHWVEVETDCSWSLRVVRIIG